MYIKNIYRRYEMGEYTVLTKAFSRSKSLRTTFPISIVKQFNFSVSDELDWKIRIERGELIITIKPFKKGW